MTSTLPHGAAGASSPATPLPICSMPQLPFGPAEPPPHPSCALEDLLPPGQVVVFGPSGSGKSVLLATLGALAHAAGRQVLHIHGLPNDPSSVATLALGGSVVRFRNDDPTQPITSPVVAEMEDLHADGAPFSAHACMRIFSVLQTAVAAHDGSVPVRNPLVTLNDIGRFAASGFDSPTDRFLADLPDHSTVIAAFDTPRMAKDIGFGCMLERADTFILFQNSFDWGSTYDMCSLTQQEHDLLYTSPAPANLSPFWFLLKPRRGDSVIVDFDLSLLKNARRLFTQTMKERARLWQLRSEHPADWLDPYLAD